jgi:hypothetical protein
MHSTVVLAGEARQDNTNDNEKLLKKYQSAQYRVAHPFCTFPAFGDNPNLVVDERHSDQTQIKKFTVWSLTLTKVDRYVAAGLCKGAMAPPNFNK